MTKTTFASRIGIIFATAGSAVGLGNIWHFPTTCGECGGAAFMLIYLAITIILGVPGMLCEFIVGRNGGRNSMFSYNKLRKGWGWIGIMGTLCSSLILGFYSVIAGWCLYYLYLAVTDQALGTTEHVQESFGNLMSPTNYVPIVLSALFIVLTHVIIVRGVQKGIEWASKIMVPTLITLLILLISASLTLPGAWDGIRFLFNPDFSKLTPDVIFAALGEAFFSLSLGTACLCTYASYFRDETKLHTSTAQIVAIDLGVAIMAGMMIFPAAFSVGVQPDAGPQLVFLTMPTVFDTAFPHWFAYCVSIVFYLLLTIAALTSTISMHEIGTALISQQCNMSRGKAALCVTAFYIVIGIISAYSMTHEGWGLFGKSFFSNFDDLTSTIMLPMGALVTAILVGYLAPRQVIIDQLTSYGRYPWAPFALKVFFFLVRFVCPVCILFIFLNKIGVI